MLVVSLSVCLSRISCFFLLNFTFQEKKGGGNGGDYKRRRRNGARYGFYYLDLGDGF